MAAQWSNYRGQADIGFFKIIDFMVDMGSFNIQMNKKNSKNIVQKKSFSKSEFKKYFSNFAALVIF
jgi:hypothetical protein